MNLYYSPEKFGLAPVGEIENGGSCEFDTFVIWRDESGALAWASDAGCSCPTPFDGIGLTDLGRGDKFAAVRALQKWAAARGLGSNVEVTGLIERVMSA